MQHGICPVCNGTGRIPAGGKNKYLYGYDAHTDTHPCKNCGGQTMSLTPTGRVPLRPDGTPCTHNYTGIPAGRCYTKYFCKHCNDVYHIDSGD